MDSEYFCENPECKRHVLSDRGQREASFIEHGEGDDNVWGVCVPVRNYRYVDLSKGKDFKLCQTCHAAVQLFTSTEGEEC